MFKKLFDQLRSEIRAQSAVPPKRDDPPPISGADLRDLFVFLDRPNPGRCTHSHAETMSFLKSRQLPVEPTIAWLRANGGACDCEVIFNVADTWGDRVDWQPAGDDDA